MRSLHLAAGMTLPIDIAGQAVVILGIRGSGKTNTAGVLAEELLDHHQPIAVIDPTDAWWGLRAGRDGNQDGGYQIFIFGGSHADVPLQEADGKIIAEFLVREQVSVILSLRHLRKGAQRRFVTEFCEELYHLKGKDANRTPLTVFIDEAPLFVPQKVMGEVARTVGAVEDLIARGRNAGFGVVLISQRSATLNADVRTQADTMICHRVTASLDRKAIEGWFEENASVDDLKAILKSLATMKNGEGWIWGPALGIMSRVHMRLRRTFDSSATPKIGQKISAPKRLVDIDLEKLKEKMLAAIEQKAADDPKALRARIAELERAAKSIPAIDPAAEQKARKESAQSVLETFREPIAALGKLSVEVGDVLNMFNSAIAFTDTITAPPRASVTTEQTEAMRSYAEKTAARLTNLRTSEPREIRTNGNGHGGDPSLGNSGLRRIMIALAQKNGLSSRQVGVRAGMSSGSGTFKTYLSKARTNGWIEGSSACLKITSEGAGVLGGYDPLPTGRALLNYWLGELGESGASRILATLANNKGKPMSDEDVGANAGLSSGSGTFKTYLSKLRTLELITGGKNDLRASEDLF